MALLKHLREKWHELVAGALVAGVGFLLALLVRSRSMRTMRQLRLTI